MLANQIKNIICSEYLVNTHKIVITILFIIAKFNAMTKLINMSQDKNFSNFHQSFVSESPKLELSYDQEPLSNYLEPHSHDIFDTRRFTPKHNQSNYKTATPDRRSRSSAIKNNSARPSSAKMISKCLYKLIGENPKCHGQLSKKIVNLEKKQEL